MNTNVLVMAMNKRNDSQETWFKIANTKATTSDETSIKNTTPSRSPQRQVFRRKDEPSVAVDNNDDDDDESGGMRPLGPNFTGPGPYDVVCARGSEARNHVGNRRFRDLIKSNIDRYSQAATKIEKSSIVSAVIDAIRRDSPGGGFVKEVDGKFFEVGDHAAREKIGQSFRDLLHTKYKSSTKAKMAKRKQLTSSPESTTNDDRSTTSAQESDASSPKKGRLDAKTSEPYYPIEPIAVSFGPPVPPFVGSSSSWSQQQHSVPKRVDVHEATNGGPGQVRTGNQDVAHAAVSTGGIGPVMARSDNAAMIFAAGSALMRRSDHLQRPAEPNGDSANGQLSNVAAAASYAAATVPAATMAAGGEGVGGVIMQNMAFPDDAHIDWEYGPISFSRFEHSLRAASEEDLADDQQINASIFDQRPDHHHDNNMMNSRAIDVAPEPERIDPSHHHHHHAHDHHHHQPQWDSIIGRRFPGDDIHQSAHSAFERTASCSSDHEDTKRSSLSLGSFSDALESLADNSSPVACCNDNSM